MKYNIDIVRFFTNDHGVIVINLFHPDPDIYITHDGGGTWNTWSILELPYPAEWGKIKRVTLGSITYEDNQYIITLYPRSEKGPSQTTTFVSKDFINWEMKEHYLMDQ